MNRSLLRSLIVQNRFYPAKTLWHSLKNPSIRETSDFLSLFTRHGLLSFSHEIYSRALENHAVDGPRYLLPYEIHYSSRLEDWDEIWNLEAKFLKDPDAYEDPDLCIYSFIKVYRTTGRLDKLAALFRFMENRGFNLCQNGWLQYFHLLAEYESTATLLSNIRLYKSQHKYLTPEIGRSIICHFGKERDVEGLKTLLSDTIDGDDDLMASNIVLSAFLRNLPKLTTDPDEAYNLVSNFMDKGYTPNVYVHFCLLSTSAAIDRIIKILMRHMRYDQAFEIYQKFDETGQPISRKFLIDLKRPRDEHPILSDLIECVSVQFSYQRLTGYLHKILKREDWWKTRDLLHYSSAISIPQAVLFVTCFQRAGDFDGPGLVRDRLEMLGVKHDYDAILKLARDEPRGDLVSWRPPRYVSGWVGRAVPEFLTYEADHEMS